MMFAGEASPLSRSETTKLDEPVARLLAFVDQAGSDASIVTPPADASTVEAAAAALAVPRSRIVKSLLFESRQGDVLLVIAGGESRVDRQRLARAAGLGHLKLASPQRVLAVTGFAVGGMPPVGHRPDLSVIVDCRVFDEPVVFGGGGRSDLLLRIRPDEIVRLTNACVADVADPSL
jgi:prolyl-tRNA editing enzyme YbaK/EbsC (Cys-tRNA(Pro) deacylase)